MEKIFKESMHSFRTPPLPNTKTTDPRGLKVRNLGGDIITHDNFVLTVHLLNFRGFICLIFRGREEISMNFWIDLKLNPITITPDPRAMNFIILVKAFLVIITLYLHFKCICLIVRSKEESFPRINACSLDNHQNPALTPEFLTPGP